MILLTGATGVVGTAVRERTSPQDLIALTHTEGLDGGHPQVRGDITQPRLGLSEDDYRALVETVDVVVHCAAKVSTATGAADFGPTNIDGTAEVLRFARSASARLVHVSTAFVDGAGDQDARHSYAGSKRQAEAAVRDSGVEYVIVRPSIIVGDSATGELSRPQGLHLLMKRLLRGPMRVMPGDATTLIDLAPVDYVADVILATATARSNGCRELWVTSGPSAVRLGRAVAILNELIGAHGGDGEVRTVSYETIDRMFVPVFLPELPRRQRIRIEAMLVLARHLIRDEPFPCSAELIDELYGIALPDPDDVALRNAERVADAALAEPVGG